MGMVQWSPDTISNPPGGYSYYDSKITGLILTHFSGRGCEVYQDFPLMPYIGSISYSPTTRRSLYYSSFLRDSESILPGSYQAHLNDLNVTLELSVHASHRSCSLYPPSTNSKIEFPHIRTDCIVNLFVLQSRSNPLLLCRILHGITIVNFIPNRCSIVEV